MADELDDAIRVNARGSAKATGDSGSPEQHKLLDQVAADRYLASRGATRSKSRGLKFNKFVRRGPVDVRLAGQTRSHLHRVLNSVAWYV